MIHVCDNFLHAIVSDTIANLDYFAASSELLNGLRNMLRSYATLDISATGKAAEGTLGSVLTAAHQLSLSTSIALALAKGTLGEMLSAVATLLSQVATTDGGSNSPILIDVPANLQSVARRARGVSSKELVLPSKQSFASGWVVDEAATRKSLNGAVADAPAAVVCDGSYLYTYIPSVHSLVKIGTGYNGTREGVIDRTVDLAKVFEAKSVSSQVHLLQQPDHKILVAATPDPRTGFGVGLRLVGSLALAYVPYRMSCLIAVYCSWMKP